MSISVLIVDDEEISRYALRTMIMKHISGIDTVLEADSGPAALNIASESAPDVIFMDIRIPGMDGLAAATKILESAPSTSIFMISAHDNFEYARKAIAIGAKGYILKPFRTEEIVPLLTSCLGGIKSKPDTASRAKFSRRALERGLMQSYLSRNSDAVLIHKAALGLEFSSAFFIVLAASPDLSLESAEGQLPYLLKGALKRDGELGLLLVPVQDKNAFPDTKTMLTTVSEMQRRFSSALSSPVRCGFGPIGTGIDGIVNSNACAIAALACVGPDGGVQFADSVRNEITDTKEALSNLEDAFMKLIREGQVNEALITAEKSLWQIFGISGMLETAIDFSTEFLVLIRNTFFKLGFMSRSLTFRQLFLELSSVGCYEELAANFKEQLGELAAALDAVPSGSQDLRQVRLMNYVNASLFKRDLSLDAAAEAAGCSPQYLCRVFRDLHDQTFTSYIKRKRIDYAKRILLSGTSSIAGIAAECGFSDVNYFCRVFKKDTGTRPNEFRSLKISEKVEGEL